MSHFYGQLVFFTFVITKEGDKRTHKRTRLGSVWCDYSECQDKLEEFRAANLDIFNPKEVHARFAYEEHIG